MRFSVNFEMIYKDVCYSVEAECSAEWELYGYDADGNRGERRLMLCIEDIRILDDENCDVDENQFNEMELTAAREAEYRAEKYAEKYLEDYE